MADLQDFIQMATSQMGITEQTARGATGGVLNLLKQQVAGSDFQELLGNLTGAETLMKESPEVSPEGGEAGGGLGGLLHKAASAIGLGGGSSALGLAGLLTQSGLEMGQIGTFVSMFVNFGKEHLGGDLLNRLLDQVPDLKKLVG